MARKNDATIRSWDDLRAVPGQRHTQIGVLRDAAAERYLQENFGSTAELKGFPEIINVMKLVEEGRLDATVQDVPVAVFYGRDFPGLHMVGEPVAPGYYVAFVRKGDDRLREQLYKALLKGLDDGTILRNTEKYDI